MGYCYRKKKSGQVTPTEYIKARKVNKEKRKYIKKDKAVQDHQKKIKRKKIKETLWIGTESRNSSTEGRHENIL